jgi:Family of unknown function (DUF5522)
MTKESDTKVELKEGLDFYYNDDGLFVFTAHYLLNRGYCCGNGCKHCPYDETKQPAK